MFRSRRRPIVFTQHEHARLAGETANAWRREDVPLPFESFVAGVALHDRGYDPLDVDEIGVVAADRWVAIQRRGFEPRGDDPIVDLVAALHIRRLMTPPDGDDEKSARRELDALVPELLASAGVDAETAEAADAITSVCDRLAFSFCFEEPDEGEVRGYTYALDGAGRIELDPWPLAAPRLDGLLTAYTATRYPHGADQVAVPFAIAPR